MSATILAQTAVAVDHRVIVLDSEAQVTAQALILRTLESARLFMERTRQGTAAHRHALRLFNDAVAMNGLLNIDDAFLAPAHELKGEMESCG